MKQGTVGVWFLAMALCAQGSAQNAEAVLAPDSETYTVTYVQSDASVEPTAAVRTVAHARALPISSKSKLLIGVLLLVLLGSLALIGSDIITKGKGDP